MLIMGYMYVSVLFQQSTM